MAAIRTLFYLMLTILLSSCGQVVSEKLTVPPSANLQKSCSTYKTIAVLPFADYSTDQDIGLSVKRNIAVMEALTDQLTAKGFRLPVYEDLVKYLVDKNIIKLASSESTNFTSSIVNELQTGEWSSQMRVELQNQLKLQNKGQMQNMQGLDKASLAQIGREFKADYIVRGRIIKYSVEDKNSWDPLKRGVLPVFFGATTRFVYGFAKTEQYDIIDQMSVGAAGGAAVGNVLDTPYSEATAHYSNYNGLTWGAIGAGAAYLSTQSGELKEAVVHVRVWAQDPSTGEVVWTNKAEVNVSPKSVYADRNQEKLFHTAVNQAISALIDDFWIKSEMMM